ADKEPNAAAVYSDCRYDNSEYVEVLPSIEGEPLDRVFQYVKRLSAVPVRGLIRLPAIRHAGLVRSDEFRAVWQHIGWLARLLHWGNFKRVPKPIYYRLSRPDSLGNEYQSRPKAWKQDVWPTMFTALLDAAIPICRTSEARLFMRRVILDQIVAYPNLRPNEEPNSLHSIVAKCVERVEFEGNSHLLDVQELPAILQGQKRRVEIVLHKRSRVRRAINESQERYQLGKLIYPQSPIKRTTYQIRHSADMLRRLTRTLARQLTA